ncbi:Hsp20/alpha crystallin family protein [Candidatus Bathyarchaeota archaeon]|nr:Hsp20/alpha crystallin family protein [Candidatus Bathyarchaeota archaeon]
MSEEEEKPIPVLPVACFFHDEEKYTVEIELPGVEKDDIHVELTETSVCIRAPRKDINIKYSGCWLFAHAVKPEEAKATFKNGLLTVTVPLVKPMKGVKVTVQ